MTQRLFIRFREEPSGRGFEYLLQAEFFRAFPKPGETKATPFEFFVLETFFYISTFLKGSCLHFVDILQQDGC